MAVNALTHCQNVLMGALYSNNYCDLALATVSGETINCHKFVMAQISAKVKSALDQKDTNKLVIRNVNIRGLTNLVQFIYNGRIEISDGGELIDFADTFTILKINLGDKVAKMVNNINLHAEDSEIDNPSEDIGFKCENCDKNFADRRRFTRHLREVHEKVKPKVRSKPSYSCEKCGTLHTVKHTV